MGNSIESSQFNLFILTMQNKLSSKDLSEVQEHYLDYPYPYRNPEDEKNRLLYVQGEYLGELNYWLFKGKENFQNNFRILIAGGGTGDGTIYIAMQLMNYNAEIIYLDFSKNSMEIAKKRAEIRGLKNITFINDSIFNIPKLNLGKFDFIQCSGVLHHLSSPDEGLKILTDSLKDNGGMNLMLYAKYGRTGVYQIQDLMKMINADVTSRTEEVANGNIIVNALPETNWYMRGKELLADHVMFGDVGLYDMFLHKQDRSYSIPELFEFINKAGLHFVNFSEVSTRMKLKIENFIKDPGLLNKISQMDKVKQLAISEIIIGSIIKHQFYVTKNKDSVASIEDLDNMPYFYGMTNLPNQIHEHIIQNNLESGSIINFTIHTAWGDNIEVNLKLSSYTKHFLKALGNEPKNLKDIFDFVRAQSGNKISDSECINEFKALSMPFIESGVLLLQDKNIPLFELSI